MVGPEDYKYSIYGKAKGLFNWHLTGIERLLCCEGIWLELTSVQLLVSLLFFLFQKGQLLRETKVALSWDRLLVNIFLMRKNILKIN